jgi:hypothetical protein
MFKNFLKSLFINLSTPRSLPVDVAFLKDYLDLQKNVSPIVSTLCYMAGIIYSNWDPSDKKLVFQ